MGNKKIDLFIIGAQKAGTTSVFEYLKEHPDISGHISQEFSFFIDDIEYSKGFSYSLKKYYNKKLNKKIIAKNAGLYVNEKAIKRLKEHNPYCKLVFILRNPVDRTISSYKMEYSSGWLNKRFNELPKEIDLHNKGNYSLMYKLFIYQSLYSENLEIILKYFNINQIEIIFFEELKNNSLNICKHLFSILDIDDSFIPNTTKTHNEFAHHKSRNIQKIFHTVSNEKNIIKQFIKKILPYNIYIKIVSGIKNINKSDKKSNIDIEIDNTTIDFLKQFYKPYNNKLKKMINSNLSYWD